MACPNNHDIGIDELEPRQFSFNGPWGACPACSGLGTRMEVDPELVIPDDEKSLSEGAIAPWSSQHVADYFSRLIDSLAESAGFSTTTPWHRLPAAAQKMLLEGVPGVVHVRYRNRYGRERSYNAKYEGVIPYIERRHAEAESDTSRERFAGYMREVPCRACKGARLKPTSLAVTIGGKNISEVSSLSIDGTASFLGQLELNERERQIAERVLKEINERLRFLLDVGLDYLSLSRPTGSLSGGEAQRIRLATQIGSGLVGVLYVLDEPSIGLHPKDNVKMIATLKSLRDIGNTVIVVEHDQDAIEHADHVVDIGLGAGEHGGRIIAQGTPEDIRNAPESLTGQYLTGRRRIEVPGLRHKPDPKRLLGIEGARGNNLKDVAVNVPVGLLVCVTGVSGSGKSTLINDTLYSAAARHLYGSTAEPAPHAAIKGLEHFDKVVNVDQSPIGRTPRSNPATYTGLFTPIRELFAGVPTARERGYGPGRFSFNVKGGRCEACQGDGVIKVEMHFLPDVYVPCEVCHGQRYNRETLEVQYKGKNITQVLAMTVEQAAEFFGAVPVIARKLHTLLDVGLGYITLGQSATTLSGGEAQRVKLSLELSKRDTGRTLYILDEPTTGLHFHDIDLLLRVLHRLRDHGNTVVVIEHNLDVIKTADWIIDLGPEGGDGGGRIIAEGAPEVVAKNAASHTGQYLKQVLN
jgi:excinuclease ABC subunit A